MRLLIAGWQGQLARALVELVPGRDDVSSFAVGRPALDLCEQPTIQRAMSDAKPDVIVNAAAYTAVDAAESDVDATFALNRDGARMLAEAAAARDIPIIHISTDYVFNGDLGRPYREDDAVDPQTVYGRSKLEGELAVAKANPRHIILRTSWVYSASGSNFVRAILAKTEQQDAIDVVCDQHGSPTYAPHLAATIIDIAVQVTGLAADAPVWGVYHAVGSGEASWFELAQALLGESGRTGVQVNPIAASQYPTAATRPADSRLDCSKLETQFGLRLPHWHDGLTACLDRLARDAASAG
ncbi:MAG: dTDP-4-dehydrorhamnose reductase [Hyphomicrobiaceae bacterium]